MTADVDVPVTPFNAEAVAAAIGATNLTGERLADGRRDRRRGRRTCARLPIDDPKFLMLVTDGAPSCAGTIGGRWRRTPRGPRPRRSPPSRTRSRRASRRSWWARRPRRRRATSRALNALAEAGGYPYGQGDIKFLTEKNLFELFIPAGDGRSCLFPLQSPPPAPDAVTVTLNGSSVPRDAHARERMGVRE